MYLNATLQLALQDTDCPAKQNQQQFQQRHLPSSLPAALPTAEEEQLPLEGTFAETQPFAAGLHLCSRNSSKGLFWHSVTWSPCPTACWDDKEQPQEFCMQVIPELQ